MKTQHTPGPWQIRSHAEVDRVYTWTIEQAHHINGHQWLISEVWSHGKDCHLPNPECEANARLIAAAPELLEALVLLLYGAEQAQKNGLNQPQINGGVILARSAIAKAKGAP